MTCPNCGASADENSNFCKNCGFAFHSIPQVEPIRVSIESEEPTVVVAPKNEPRFVPPQQTQPPQIIVERRATNTPLIVLLALTLIIASCALVFFAYVYFNRDRQQQTAATTTNVQANTITSAAKTPTPRPTEDYEDWRNSIAPEDRSATILDDQFTIDANSYRSINFTVPSDAKNARIVGGLKVSTNEPINLNVYSNSDYEFRDSAQPVLAIQARNKKINLPLKPGDYVLVFEAAPSATHPALIASEILVVYE